jgi:two-component system OmpR family sensor kinase
MSIRRKLTFWLLTSVLAAGLLASAVVFFQARAEANGLFDYQLRQIAIALRDRSFLPGQLDEVLQGEDAREVVVQVWAPDGRRIYTSDANASAPAVIRLGFDNLEGVGGHWRIFGIQQRGLTFQVAQPMSVRDDLALAAAQRTLMPFLIALPLIGLLIWQLVGREFRPLDTTAQAVARRNPNSMQPIDAANAPDEVRPLIASLNDLLSRLGDTLSLQRQFVADAAHELRTPLTALHLQLQLAERASTDGERIQAHGALREGIARATHLVEQLLALARMDPGTPMNEAANVDLLEVARSVVRNSLVVAESRAVSLECADAGSVIVTGDPSGLRMLADNLMSNAINHSPAGGKVTVSVRRDGGFARLQVEDEGRGIPAAERERVFARFYRGESAAEGGSGLGLAIVRRVAERHGGAVELADAARGGSGLRVIVSLPFQPEGNALSSA